ncbi:MAG: hypothetical protein ACKO37_05915 [Vampirovibrionales bacterium]
MCSLMRVLNHCFRRIAHVMVLLISLAWCLPAIGWSEMVVGRIPSGHKVVTGEDVRCYSVDPTRQPKKPEAQYWREVTTSVEGSSLSTTNPNHSFPPQSVSFKKPAIGQGVPNNLWGIESKRLIRSPLFFTPDRRSYVYSETMFLPRERQVVSELYQLPVPYMPMAGSQQSMYQMQQTLPLTQMPLEETPRHLVKPTIPSINQTTRAFVDYLDPVKMAPFRQRILGAGDAEKQPFSFQTLVPVDWSPDGQRLLLRTRKGVLHETPTGTDLLVYDRKSGSVWVYPELWRRFEPPFTTQSMRLQPRAYDVMPLGFKAHSTQEIIYAVRSFRIPDPFTRKPFPLDEQFHGFWSYHLDRKTNTLLSETMTDHARILAQVGTPNGWIATVKLAPEVLSNGTDKEHVTSKTDERRGKKQKATPKYWLYEYGLWDDY